MLFIHPNLVALRSIKSCLPRDVLVLSLQLISNKKVSRTLDQFSEAENDHFRGLHSTVDSILASHPAAPGLILSIPKIFSEFLDVVEIYQQQCTA